MIIQQGRKGSGTSVTEFGLTSVRTISWRGRGVGEWSEESRPVVGPKVQAWDSSVSS